MARPPFEPDKTYCLGEHPREDPQEVEAAVTVATDDLADELAARARDPRFTSVDLVDAVLAVDARGGTDGNSRD